MRKVAILKWLPLVLALVAVGLGAAALGVALNVDDGTAGVAGPTGRAGPAGEIGPVGPAGAPGQAADLSDCTVDFLAWNRAAQNIANGVQGAFDSLDVTPPVSVTPGVYINLGSAPAVDCSGF